MTGNPQNFFIDDENGLLRIYILSKTKEVAASDCMFIFLKINSKNK